MKACLFGTCGSVVVLLLLFVLPVPVFTQDCAAVPGLTPLLKPGVLLVGEMHGTVESPQFVERVACAASASGLPIVVALEMPAGEDVRIAAFMNSPGADANRHALLSSPFWSDRYQDGRRSVAMVDLLNGLRLLRQRYPRLYVVLIDEDSPAVPAQVRDRGMAERVAHVATTTPDAFVVVLTGNYHTRVVGDAAFEPMGAALQRLKPTLNLTALDVAYSGGAAWLCTGAAESTCGVRELKGRDTGGTPGITLYAERGQFDGVYHVGVLTPSPPASNRTSQAGGRIEPTDLDWTIGDWRGTRTSADGQKAAAVVRVERLAGAAGQFERMEVASLPRRYVGFAVRVPSEGGGWTMAYGNSNRESLAHLRGTIDGERSTWTSWSAVPPRGSRLVFERPDALTWRRTQFVTEHVGDAWQVLFVDELRRVGGDRMRPSLLAGESDVWN